MNKRILNTYQQICERAGLSFDTKSGVMYGTLNGYSVLVYPQSSQYPLMLQAKIPVHRAIPLEKEEIKQLKSASKGIQNVSYDSSIVTISFSNGSGEKLVQKIESALIETLSFLSQNGFVSCCPTCGKNCVPQAASIAGNYISVCDDCFISMMQNVQLSVEQEKNKKENVLAGIVGAFLGSILGGASIVLFSQFGYVAALSGLIMAICTIKGYEILGGKLTKKGVLFSLLIMVVMAYIADRLDWALIVAKELEEDLFSSYQAVPALIQHEIIDSANYYGSLILMYFFLGIGAIPTLIGAFLGTKPNTDTYRLQNSNTYSEI